MKKALVVMLVLAMMVFAAACNNGGGNDTPADNTPADNTPADTTPADNTPSGDDPYADLEPVNLIYACGAALGAVGDLWAEEFVRQVESITGGKLTIDYYGNSQLGADVEMLTQMQAGDIDMINMQPSNAVGFVPANGIFDLPLVFARYDADTIDSVLKEGPFVDALNEAFAEGGLIVLDMLQSATFRETTSNKEIRTVADFSGLKIRTMSSEYDVAFWTALGTNPTPLAFTELYMSLQQGVVDAQENAVDTCVSSAFYEVQDYMIRTKHKLYLNQCMMNLDRWNSLDPAYQDAIMQALYAADAVLQPQIAQIDADNTAVMEENNVEVIVLGDDVLDEIIELSQGVYDMVRNDIGDEIVDLLVNGLEGK